MSRRGRALAIVSGTIAGAVLAVGIWVAVACLVTVLGLVSPAAGLVCVLAALVPYLVVLGAGTARLGRLPLASRWRGWLAVAISEEEQELAEVIHPPHGHRRDVVTAAVALVVVVGASVVMEQSASALDPLNEHEVGTIRDANGNTVGKWEVVES